MRDAGLDHPAAFSRAVASPRAARERARPVLLGEPSMQVYLDELDLAPLAVYVKRLAEYLDSYRLTDGLPEDERFDGRREVFNHIALTVWEIGLELRLLGVISDSYQIRDDVDICSTDMGFLSAFERLPDAIASLCPELESDRINLFTLSDSGAYTPERFFTPSELAIKNAAICLATRVAIAIHTQGGRSAAPVAVEKVRGAEPSVRKDDSLSVVPQANKKTNSLPRSVPPKQPARIAPLIAALKNPKNRGKSQVEVAMALTDNYLPLAKSWLSQNNTYMRKLRKHQSEQS